MSSVERNGDQFIVDAQMLATAFGLTAEAIRTRMQDGQITSLCEAGEGEDANRWRLTFRHQGRALRVIVDAQGKILSRSTFPVGHSGRAVTTDTPTPGNPPETL